LVVRVLPDVPAIDKTFDYLVPDAVRDQVRVGDVVRIVLHGRRVGGWIVAVGVDPPAGVELRPLAKRSGRGPGIELIELAGWAAWRWAGRPASFLKPASPPTVVPAVSPVPSEPAPAVTGDPLLAGLADRRRSVVRLPPGEDPLSVVDGMLRLGSLLVLCPTAAMARTAFARLQRAGVRVAGYPRDWAIGAQGATVVGTRSAAWAPVAGLAGIVVLDEHDESHQQEQTPTWSARDVAMERAERAGVPCTLVSPTPSLEALAWGQLVAPDRSRERAGWPPVEVVDRRDEDPRRAGLWSPALVRLLRSDRRVLCVLNRTGRAKLLACNACGELARCERCEAAVGQPEADFACERCGTQRPAVCLRCGSTRFKNARIGVTRAREELEALVGEPVTELTAATPPDAPLTRVVIGTEAVLQRVARADAVAFVDLDQELLAPRYRSSEQALALVARAARVVAGSTTGGTTGRARGHLLVQTRTPHHEVVQAVVAADPASVARAEDERRRLLRFPPHAAMAAVSGPAAPAYVAALGRPLGIDVVESSPGHWLLRAPDHRTLCDALAAVPRPSGRLRIEVDPLRA
jgi:primosomal protein N' (replication factor Y)